MADSCMEMKRDGYAEAIKIQVPGSLRNRGPVCGKSVCREIYSAAATGRFSLILAFLPVSLRR